MRRGCHSSTVARRATSRERELTEDEIRTFWAATETMAPAMQAYFRLRLITAQRGCEVAAMKWSNVDLAKKWWTIPSEIAKNGKTHRVPLSTLAVEIILTPRAHPSSLSLKADKTTKTDQHSEPVH